jgi:hypothetical protein
MSFKSIFLFVLMTVPAIGSSQNVPGLWKVLTVEVNGSDKTPVAKWTRINDDGSFQSGNGWLQNSEGTWTFDESDKTYLPVETIGMDDPYGPFAVSLSGDTMIWKRQEDGEQIQVTLKRTVRLPKSTADMLTGIWDLQGVNSGSAGSLYGLQDTRYIFIRWDRIYVQGRIDGKRESGYWHINGHKPEITLISHLNDKKTSRWTVEVSDMDLKLTGIEDHNSGVVVTLKRVRDFPK